MSNTTLTRGRSPVWSRVQSHPLIRHLPLLLVLVVAAGLRFYALDRTSLWSDEGNTWALIQRTYAQIAADAAADIHPPGYYWLLKSWSLLWGTSAAAMRALSALLGVAVVGMVYAIGARLNRETGRFPWLAWTAAWLAALNPFLLYYSQEARMYMLLTLAGAGLFWALLAWMGRENPSCPQHPPLTPPQGGENRDRVNETTAPPPAGGGWEGVSPAEGGADGVFWPLFSFVLAGMVGVWTHYSFPILLAAAGVAYLRHWLRLSGRPLAPLWRYIGANLVVILLFVPWLPTAITRVAAWPKGGVTLPPLEGLATALRTLIFGPLRELPEPLLPWLVVGGLLPLLGAAALIRKPAGGALAWWGLAPLGLMFALGLWSDAFLKFLLTAAPAWALLSAAAPRLLPRRAEVYGALLVALLGTAPAWAAFPVYYGSSSVRDNYAGVARYVDAVANPATDLVLLNAPGQADVWGYYDPGVPVIALPQQRPPDPDATRATLAAAVRDRHQLFALFWATDEADPDRVVESWLDQHAFRGLESWQGNLRFVVYTLPGRLDCRDFAAPVAFGDAVELLGHCQPAHPQTVPAGQVALVELRWRTAAPLSTRYKVTLQLLDPRNQVIAQHDAEPAGGSRPTDGWTPEEIIGDNHGLPIPFGTPPGDYRLIVAVYEGATGVRLPTVGGDAHELGTLQVTRPDRALPPDVLPIAHHIDRELGPVWLLGYDLYKQGHSYAPETPIVPGDLVHVTLYWQTPAPLPPDWPADAHFTLRLGDQQVTAPLAGGAYPTGDWQPGELVRGEFDLPYSGGDGVPRLELNGGEIELRRLP